MARYVGLDAHSKNCVYAIQDEQGKWLGEGTIPTTLEGLLRLQAEHALPAGTAVALESGTMAFFVARRLERLGLDPQVIDAYEVRAKAVRPNQKSDRRDARELCEGLRRELYRTRVHVPPEAIEHLRETLGRRRHFVNVKTMEVNAAKRLLRAAGLRLLSRSLATESGWQKLLASLDGESSLEALCQAHHALWRCADEQVAVLEASLAVQGEPLAPTLKRLQTVPGVGPIVALTVVAAFSEVTRFPSAKHAASYAGLVASSYDSGERVRHGHITRRGSSELRAMLCEAAHHAARATSPFHPDFLRLLVHAGYKKAIVATAHQLCRTLYAMLRDGTAFDPGKLNLEEGTFKRTIVTHYRRKKLARPA
jgi:transposase